MKDGADLDHETKPTLMVTLTANDGSGASNATANITVTIYVTDVDEPPVIMGAGGLAVSGQSSVNYEENGMGSVATYTASGPNADSATWSLGGDDAGAFGIGGGVLTFNNVPNYEMPTDADADNTYVVTVMADDGTNMVSYDVMVMVTNMEEMGTVTLSPMAPSVDTEITADLVDEDGGITGTTWQWAKHAAPTDGSMPADDSAGWMDITGETSMTYTPVAADVGYYLRATASYTDGHGSGKTAMGTTATR